MHGREIDQTVATREPIRGVVPVTGMHGRRIYDGIFVPVFGTDGSVEVVAGTTRDVTEAALSRAARRAGCQAQAARPADRAASTLSRLRHCINRSRADWVKV